MNLEQSTVISDLEPSIKALTQVLQSFMESCSGPQPFKQAVLTPAPGPEIRHDQRRDQARDTTRAHPGRPGRSEAARLKMAELRRLSSPKSPWCFRCGGKGHLAPACRNKVVCFACNRLGHCSSQCRAIGAHPAPRSDTHPPFPHILAPQTASTSHIPIQPTPPNTDLPPFYNPSAVSIDTTVPHTPVVPIFTDLPQMPRGQPIQPAIRTFHATEASERLEAAFKLSFLLHDIEHWGPDRVQAALYQMSGPHFRHDWVVRIFDDYRYLVLAPSQIWLDNSLSRQTLLLENRDIPIQEWDPSYAQGMRMIPIWIRIKGFPMMLWQSCEFEKLLDDFGAILLDQDLATEHYWDWRHARLKVGICDPNLLPPSHWIMYKDSSGYVSRYDIIFEVEHAMEGVYTGVKRPRSEGGYWKPKPPGSGHRPPPG